MYKNSLKQAEDFAEFVRLSPSSFHAVKTVSERLLAAGWTQQFEDEDWQATPGGHFVVRDGAIIAFMIPESVSPLTPYRIIGGHTDSPAFKVKPNPQSKTGDGFTQIGVEVYGGPLLNSWLDRDLAVAGRLTTKSGQIKLVRTDAILRIPQLAVHLDRAVNNDGLKLGKQQHLHPVMGVDSEADFLDLVAKAAGLSSGEEIDSYELYTIDAQGPDLIGADANLFASPRLDNLVTVHSALAPLLALDSSINEIAVYAMFDNEEVGSQSRAGAGGSLLNDVITRTSLALGATMDQIFQAKSKTIFVSCDVGHSVHPNYADRHDPDTRPIMGRGPMVKHNAQLRYISHSPEIQVWHEACRLAEVKCQDFVSNNDQPCGSTIGPISIGSVGVPTVDVGIPILSMHSARELCHIDDCFALSKVFLEFWRMSR
ncbi:M18 family aminopeptidase [Boudabousia tangfeifanii]|uniref:M18 family aminopeptidase n=1 Tax=Boudabousia tangfeifanii TaxID=1912795 RepID=A0A1D9MMD4_9ACTO|nr:M18 family aminopeptidase [Boudabousia tangfeifanii]AOZ73445.1 M18 family aminopeptidase [Boudabousia tangfeifanii]